MATEESFINYVVEQLAGLSCVGYKKMFGEYMVYYNSKPVITVCDNTTFVKKLDCLSEILSNAEVGYPYNGAKEHYILDIDDIELSLKVVRLVESVTPLPKHRKGK